MHLVAKFCLAGEGNGGVTLAQVVIAVIVVGKRMSKTHVPYGMGG